MSVTRTPTLPALVAVVMISACSTAGRFSLQSSPYDEYVAMLRSAGLDKTTLGEQWTAAGESAVRSAAPVSSPFGESGYFAAGQPTAVAYRLELRRGRQLAIEVGFETSEPGRLFVDLFRIENTNDLRRVASLEADAPLLEYSVDRDATYVLRLQPELLRSGRFTLIERTLASIRTFPVSNLTSRAVQSGFGMSRDSGTRSHEGIDIFAPRGTPVIAVVDGVARTDTNSLGGNVVWLRDGLIGGTRYYYAHLDGWAIDGSARVRQGDVLGYVGNTGNARTTLPHLHFGVYDDGAIDPAPFLQADESLPMMNAKMPLLGALVRSQTARTPLRAGPSSAAAQRLLLESETVAQRLGVTGMWDRVMLPDGVVGYVPANALVTADVPLRRRRATGPVVMREKPQPAAPVITTLMEGTAIEILGRFQQFDLVRAPDGAAGWAESAKLSAAASD